VFSVRSDPRLYNEKRTITESSFISQNSVQSEEDEMYQIVSSQELSQKRARGGERERES
jgi:hypothetical protein